MNTVSLLFVPLLIIIAIVYSTLKKNNSYASFIKGSKEGLSLFKEIFPSVLAMFLAVSLLNASGMIKDLGLLLAKVFPDAKVISEMIPLIIMKPISDSASYAVVESICSVDINSFECKMASIIHGSSENTFFVLSLYFTSVGITKWKKALHVGLITDAFGIMVAIFLSIIFLQ